MAEILKQIVILISKLRNWLADLANRCFGISNDKVLHFIVIGILGLLIYAFVYLPIRYLVRKRKTNALAFLYALTVISTLAFMIEIGQKITDTGIMDMGDIIWGVSGFVIMYLIIAEIKFLFIKLRRKPYEPI